MTWASVARVCAMGVLLLSLTVPGGAKEIAGVSLPDSLQAGDGLLTLNGAGVRTKFFIKVYACGLYLQHKSSDAPSILASDDAMAVRMHFIYKKISSEKIVETWNESFHKAAGKDFSSIESSVQAFNSLFSEDIHENDVFDLMCLPGKGVDVVRNGELLGTIEGRAFRKALLSIWIGPDPISSKLKNQMLGL